MFPKTIGGFAALSSIRFTRKGLSAPEFKLLPMCMIVANLRSFVTDTIHWTKGVIYDAAKFATSGQASAPKLRRSWCVLVFPFVVGADDHNSA